MRRLWPTKRTIIMIDPGKKETSNLAGSDVSPHWSLDDAFSIIPGVGSNLQPPAGGPEGAGGGEVPTPSNNVGSAGYANRKNDISDEWASINPKISGLMTIGLHWVSLTLYCRVDVAEKIYSDFLFDTLGPLTIWEHGVRWFNYVKEGLYGFRLCYEPTTKQKNSFVTYTIPGAACERLEPGFLAKVYKECEKREIKVSCTRLDYKFDYCNFSPYQFRWMLKNSVVRKCFENGKIRTIQNEEVDEMGLGSQITVYTGAITSNRMLCCYDEHGFTRLEMRNKGDFSDAIARLLIGFDPTQWMGFLLAQVPSYLHFDHPLWERFLSGAHGGYVQLSKETDYSMERLWKTFLTQYVQLVSIIYDDNAPRFKAALEVGRRERRENSKYAVILHRYGLDDSSDV